MSFRILLPCLLLCGLSNFARGGIVVNRYISYDSSALSYTVAPSPTQSFDVNAMYQATLDYGDQDGKFDFFNNLPDSNAPLFFFNGARYRDFSTNATIELKITGIKIADFRIVQNSGTTSTSPVSGPFSPVFYLENAGSAIQLQTGVEFDDHTDYINDLGLDPNDNPGFFSKIEFQLMAIPNQNLAGFSPDELELDLNWQLDQRGADQDSVQLVLSTTDTPNVVPEPASLAWASFMGLIGGAGLLRRKRGNRR